MVTLKDTALCTDILPALVFFHGGNGCFINEVIEFIVGVALYLDPCDAMAGAFLEQRFP